ncbi:hypothetical protein GCM10010383_72240 [Streptomyces lomondensis]|uniref:Transposase n=1 Tax=Streptomyces lomondensis TaxID=68229 RepID=A0ABQ2XS19_9ACTN|nr:hypothetical protein GCM10010383_72240 [Streptomyces lomondensis]
MARALDAVELRRPSGITHEVVFRRCPDCQEHNIVREVRFLREAYALSARTRSGRARGRPGPMRGTRTHRS